MSGPPSVRHLVTAALLALATGCSSASATHTPPTYTLHGDACGAVPVGTFAALSGGLPSTQVPKGLTQGLEGGNCEMEFDGDDGYLKLTTFIAINPTGTDAATSMYTKFKTYDTANADNDTTISDVTDLGSAAYLESQHLSGSTPWKPTDTWLYKFGVQDGNLVLTLVLSGYARTESEWPTSEKALQDQLQSAVKQILQKLAA